MGVRQGGISEGKTLSQPETRNLLRNERLTLPYPVSNGHCELLFCSIFSSVLFTDHHPVQLKYSLKLLSVITPFKLPNWQDMSLSTMSNLTNQKSSLRPTYAPI